MRGVRKLGIHASVGVRVLAALLLWLTVGGAGAMWAGFSDEQLVAASDIIVLGEVVGSQPDREAMRLKVSETLKGEVDGPEVLLSSPPAQAPRSSTDIVYQVGQKGLWFLRISRQSGQDKVYSADHPQRFISAEQAQAIEAFRNRLRSTAR